MADLMALFRQRPVLVEAVQYTGANTGEVLAWMGIDAETAATLELVELVKPILSRAIDLDTVGGGSVARPGWWIVKDPLGAFHVCGPHQFDQAYEALQ